MHPDNRASLPFGGRRSDEEAVGAHSGSDRVIYERNADSVADGDFVFVRVERQAQIVREGREIGRGRRDGEEAGERERSHVSFP
jgi:hypothetical protein